jgi:glycosyltransferase involved in cell wall biosynthesis
VLLLQDLKFGGSQRQALELAGGLDPARFGVEIWLLAGGDDLAPRARSYDIPLRWLSRTSEVGPAALAALWCALKTSPPDLLLPFTVVPNIWGRMLGRLALVPRIIGNCRGGAAPGRQYERALWRLTDHLLTNSQALRMRLLRDYQVPPAHVTVISNGVDTHYFRPAAAAPAGPPVVLALARFVAEKDHDTLLRAFKLVAATHPGAQLWLVGEGPREGAVQGLTQDLLLQERVRFLPPQAEVLPWLHRASLLVLSSVTEALPNVVLEAMAAGLPVVATRVGGLPELVVPGRTGWLAPPGSPPALAAALSHLLGAPETRTAFGRAGRRRAVQHFSLEAMAQGFAEVLEAMLQGGGSLPPRSAHSRR